MRILFVCLGNICRSPLGEGIFRSHVEQAGLADRIETDSAGTGDWHAGEAPDARAIAVARENGIDISAQRARQITRDDFARFDLVIAMDRTNESDLKRLCPPDLRGRIRRLREFDVEAGHDVPDPWFGTHGFDLVFTMIERCSRRILDHVRTDLPR